MYNGKFTPNEKMSVNSIASDKLPKSQPDGVNACILTTDGGKGCKIQPDGDFRNIDQSIAEPLCHTQQIVAEARHPAPPTSVTNEPHSAPQNSDDLVPDKLLRLPNTPTDTEIPPRAETINLRNKNVLILGFGVSGQGAFHALKQLGANIFLCADNLPQLPQVAPDVALVKKITPKLVIDMDLIVLSPTTRLEAKIRKAITENNIDCIGELELGYRFCKGSITAVTGTNGKTTTATLINGMFSTSYNSYLLGNIGKSFSERSFSIAAKDKVVLECSSFQLAQTKLFHPHIACLLNLAPDHLDFHKDLDDYYNAKLQIFRNMNESDFAVVNFDDNACYELTKSVKAQLYYYSLTKPCKGVFIQDETIMFSDGVIIYTIEKLENLQFFGSHNLQNMLCATCVAILAGVSVENVAEILRNFHLPPHRIEFVKKYKGVDYFNDSKSTNIASCVAACKTFKKPVHLLLGGSDKGENFKQLNALLPQNIKSVYLFGRAQKRLFKALKKCPAFEVFKCNNLTSAIKFAALKAQGEELVLLSPACASFDTFENFEQRGDYFKAVVNALDKD